MEKIKQLELENQLLAVFTKLTKRTITDLVHAVGEVDTLINDAKDKDSADYFRTHRAKLVELYKSRREEEAGLDTMRKDVLAALKEVRRNAKG